MKVYYNEIEPSAIIWLHAAMDAGYIANGDIDTRSIEDVTPNDLMGYDRCHFFAGIGGWELALQLADYKQQGVLWTGSCPCQSFSTAGKGAGFNDPRHLWPAWLWLIQQCKPDTIYGEQVAAAIGKGWLDLVANDLEGEGYATTAAVLPACSVGAPHKRDRLWFVANSSSGRRNPQPLFNASSIGGENNANVEQSSKDGTLGNAKHNGQSAAALTGSKGQAIQHNAQGQDSASELTRASPAEYVANAESGAGWHERKNERKGCNEVNAFTNSSRVGNRISLPRNRQNSTEYVADTQCERQSGQGQLEQSVCSAQNRIGETDWPNYFSEVEWIDCPDGKQRLVKSGLCLLVDGLPTRLRKAALHGFGNAIVPQVAAEFIMATR